MDFGQIEIEFWTTESPLGSHREGFFYVPMLISAPSAPFPFSVHKAAHKNKRLPKLYPNRNLFVPKGNHFYFLLSTILRASFL